MPVDYYTECDACEYRIDRKMTDVDDFPLEGWCCLKTALTGEDGVERPYDDDNVNKYGLMGHTTLCPECSEKLLDLLYSLSPGNHKP